jgi:hypothetical protein
MTAYVAARRNARPVSTGSRIRAATFRPAHIVRERQKRRVMLARQPNGPFNDTVELSADHHLGCVEALSSSRYQMTSVPHQRERRACANQLVRNSLPKSVIYFPHNPRV